MILHDNCDLHLIFLPSILLKLILCHILHFCTSIFPILFVFVHHFSWTSSNIHVSVVHYFFVKQNTILAMHPIRSANTISYFQILVPQFIKFIITNSPSSLFIIISQRQYSSSFIIAITPLTFFYSCKETTKSKFLYVNCASMML